MDTALERRSVVALQGGCHTDTAHHNGHAIFVAQFLNGVKHILTFYRIYIK